MGVAWPSFALEPEGKPLRYRSHLCPSLELRSASLVLICLPSQRSIREVIQLPPVLLSGTGLAGGDKVLLAAAVQNDSTMHTKPRVAAEIKLRVRGTALFKDVDLSGRLNGSSAQPVPFSAINKTLLAAFAKEILCKSLYL